MIEDHFWKRAAVRGVVACIGLLTFVSGSAAETWQEIGASYPPTRDFIDSDSVVKLRRDAQLFQLRRKQLFARPEASGARSLVETLVVDCDSIGQVAMTQEWYDEAQTLFDKTAWSRTREEAVTTLARDPLIRNREPRRAVATCQGIRRLQGEGKVVEDFSLPPLSGERPSLPNTFQGRVAPGSAAPPDRPQVTTEQYKVGSGFFVAPDGTFVTAAHVVAACTAVSIEAKGAAAPAAILSLDTTRDIALARAKVRPRSFARFAVGGLRQGEQVVSYGFPLVGAISSGGNSNTGYVAALSGLRDDQNMLQVSVPVQPGNSGGPLVDLSGAVVGVVKGKLRAETVFAATGALPENVNFAVKASVVMEMMKAARIPYQTAVTATPGSVADASEDARLFTVRVNCR
jgi:S1-C subfamily serine protease